MKHKTNELTGSVLNAAVAKAQGMEFELVQKKVWGDGSGIAIVSECPACRCGNDYFDPSTEWADGGPIIESEHINITGRTRNGQPNGEWCADLGKMPLHFGPTPLIAAMRAYVAHKLGDEVEL